MSEVHQHPQGEDHVTLCWPMRGLETNCRGWGHQTFHTIKIRTFIDVKPHMKYIDEVDTLTLHRPAWLLQCSFDCSSEWVSSFNHTRRYGPGKIMQSANGLWLRPLAKQIPYALLTCTSITYCNATQRNASRRTNIKSCVQYIMVFGYTLGSSGNQELTTVVYHVW